MDFKTITRLDQLRIGDSFVYINRVDPWRVTARANKSGMVAVNQFNAGTRSFIHKYDELKRGTTAVMFLRHTQPVAGEQCLIDDLQEGSIFYRPEDLIHEYELVRLHYPFSDVRRLDHASPIKAGIFSKVIFLRQTR